MRASLCRAALLLAGLACLSAYAADAPPGKWQNASLEDYRKHLTALQAQTADCAQHRDLNACDPMKVGLDDYVAVDSGGSAERRLVRYGWLRVLFSRAAEPVAAADAGKAKAAPAESAQPAPLTVPQLLDGAKSRLAADLARSYQAPPAAADRAADHALAREVLAGREFRNLGPPDAGDAAAEELSNWLNRMFAAVDRWRSHSPWLGRAVVGCFLLCVGVGLAWGLVQLERRWRIRLAPELERPAADAPSARDWQLWLADARRYAAEGAWRQAIHMLYWAAIARLESKRLWPADRARTPREYLALLAADDPRRGGLASLTRSFERTWYGGRAAGESEYRAAEQYAAGLLASGRAGSAAHPDAEARAH